MILINAFRTGLPWVYSRISRGYSGSDNTMARLGSSLLVSVLYTEDPDGVAFGTGVAMFQSYLQTPASLWRATIG